MPIGELLALKDGRVELAPASVDIREVRVSAPPIVQRSDTIAYNVASFKGQEDRYIADVLKKLPGITVDGEGKISYLGEAISKLYVEGRDLLGGQYGLATNNLSADAVGSVEVMELHQPIRALQGVKFAEQAAINLKLKKGYTIRPFGEVRLGWVVRRSSTPVAHSWGFSIRRRRLWSTSRARIQGTTSWVRWAIGSSCSAGSLNPCPAT